MEKKDHSFIIFACAGCSKAGQAAYQIALELDRRGAGEMSCLAGIAAGKPSFDKKIHGKKVLTIDGCPIECSKAVFENRNIPVDVHVQLKDHGVKKTDGASPDMVQKITRVVEDSLSCQEASTVDGEWGMVNGEW